jgi:hypothetical protein
MNKPISQEELISQQDVFMKEITTAQTADDVKTIVNALNAGWRNEVASQLGMDKKTFQAAQGVLGLQTSDSSGLFRMADAVPSTSTTQYYTPSSASHFSSTYNNLLHALKPSSSGGLKVALGPMYAKWVIYRSADTSDKTQLELFTFWANRNLDPGKAAAAITTFKAAASDPLNLAYDAYVDKANLTTFVDDASDSYTLPSYSCTISQAHSAVLVGGTANIAFDSTTMDTSSDGTTVKGSASGMFDIFSAGASGSYDSLDKMAASSGFKITGTISNYGTLAVTRGGWYTSGELTRAYTGKNDDNIWDPLANQGNWDSFFGPDGSMPRRVSQLLLVSGYDITVTSEASYSASQYKKITTDASVGIWPFFSVNVSTTHTTKFSQGANGELIVRYKQNDGQIAIWGATITDLPG